MSHISRSSVGHYAVVSTYELVVLDSLYVNPLLPVSVFFTVRIHPAKPRAATRNPDTFAGWLGIFTKGTLKDVSWCSIQHLG